MFHAAWLFAVGIRRKFHLASALTFSSLVLLHFCADCGVAGWRVAWVPLAALWCLLGAWCAEAPRCCGACAGSAL
jgi:hypothetical protein